MPSVNLVKPNSETASYMRAAAGHRAMLPQQPPPVPAYTHGFQGYSQDFSVHNTVNPFYGYNQMSNAQPFIYHTEGDNLIQPGTVPHSSLPSYADPSSQCDNGS